jgi:carbon-monoxide dehydrogenase medium subunit
MYPAEFGYLRASSVAHALDVLADGADGDDEVKVLAGGQSLLPMMKLRLATPGLLLDIGGLADLAGIEDAGIEDSRTGDAPIGDHRGGSLRVGAVTTYRTLHRDPRIGSRFPAITDALRVLADPQVRARGTVGGAVAHGDPAADLPAVLLALNARLTLARVGGTRTLAIDDFLLGIFETDLAEDELVTAVAIPPASVGQAYQKFEQPASHLPLAGVCAVVELADGVITAARIAVTGVAGRAFRASEAEATLTGQEPVASVLDAAAAQVRAAVPRPLEDIHATASFRLHLAEILTRRAGGAP